ncbi:MAG: hypothetical protein R3298_10960 [Gammaproteobacteria bacterium]|nr:hypothetical protein [Gammaproteobacteria bacterium]
MMTYQTKVLRVLLAVVIWAFFADAAGATDGAAYFIFSPFGDMKELVVAGVIAWLALPFVADPS